MRTFFSKRIFQIAQLANSAKIEEPQLKNKFIANKYVTTAILTGIFGFDVSINSIINPNRIHYDKM